MSGTSPGGRPPRHISAAAMFAGNLLLALVWVAMLGRFDVVNMLVGFALGYIVLFVLRGVIGHTRYFVKSVRLVRFVGFYVSEVLRSNIRVAYDVVTPASRARPGVVAVPLDAETNAEITLLSNLITMTPGSLAIDVSDDRSVMYIHSMFVEDPDEVRRVVKDEFERRVLELMR